MSTSWWPAAKGPLIDVCLLPEDLDDWAEALEPLAGGRPVRWMDAGRNSDPEHDEGTVHLPRRGPQHDRARRYRYHYQ
ncbi:DUF5959 family protein [Streptomyces sp. NPDC059215]|uniref:DUF5959 family protein n=1 Tax=Streptomyces sp. NPDC059215 TaxID=3346772 RepID=UPI0036C86946